MKGSRPLSDEEVALVAKSFGGVYAKRNRAMFLVGIRTGFRISEILSLRVGDVQQHGKILGAITVQRRHMKGVRPAKPRAVR
jgi:integrase